MEEKNFRLNQGDLPKKVWRLLSGNVGVVKTRRRLSVRCLGAYSIFRLTNTVGTKFVFEVYDPQKGMAFVIMAPPDNERKSYEDRIYLGPCYIGKPLIELGENLFFSPIGRQIQVVRDIQKIEILEEHPLKPCLSK